MVNTFVITRRRFHQLEWLEFQRVEGGGGWQRSINGRRGLTLKKILRGMEFILIETP